MAAGLFGCDVTVVGASPTATSVTPGVPDEPVVPATPTAAGSATSLSAGRWFTSTSKSPVLTWVAPATFGTGGLGHYEYSLGTIAGAIDIKGWTSTGTALRAQATGLSLVDGTSYYLNVRVVNGAGAVSSVTSSSPWRVTVNGAAAFAAKVDYTAVANPRDVKFVDLVGNGHPALVCADGAPGASISVLLNNGEGTFAAKPDSAVLNNAQMIAVADYNGDHHLDLAIANYISGPPTSFSVFTGLGNGGLSARADTVSGTDMTSIFTADFNGDHKPDLLVTDYAASTVIIYLNDGSASFAPSGSAISGGYPTGRQPQAGHWG